MRPTFLKALPIFDPFFLFALVLALAFAGGFFSSRLGVGVGEGDGDAEGEGVAASLDPVVSVVLAERRAK